MPASLCLYGDTVKAKRDRRIRLFDFQFHFPDRRKRKQKLLRYMPCHGLQQIKAVFPHIIIDKQAGRAIIHGIRNIVAFSRFFRIGIEHRIDAEVLPLLLFLLVYAMVGKYFKIPNPDLIHSPCFLCCFFRHFYLPFS